MPCRSPARGTGRPAGRRAPCARTHGVVMQDCRLTLRTISARYVWQYIARRAPALVEFLRTQTRNTIVSHFMREHSRGRRARAPGRREHERKHSKGVAREQLQDGQRERRGLAAAGVRGAHHVAPAQDGWDAAALHSRWVLHAQRLAHPVARHPVKDEARPAPNYKAVTATKKKFAGLCATPQLCTVLSSYFYCFLCPR